MANIAFKRFLIPFIHIDARTIWDHQLYFFHSLGATIFFGCCYFHELYRVFTQRRKLFQTSMQTTKM